MQANPRLVQTMRLLVLLFLFLLYHGCNGNDDPLAEKLANMKKSLDFTVLAPTYLPPGTDPIPAVDPAQEDGILYYFVPSQDTSKPAAQRARVEITQTRVKSPSLTPFRGIYPTDLERADVNGSQVLIRRPSGQFAEIQFFTTYKEFDITVVLAWPGPLDGPPIVLSQEMENEGWKVLRSILR